MKDCAYCKMIEGGAYPEDHEQIFDFEICKLSNSEMGDELSVYGTLYYDQLCVGLAGHYYLFQGVKKINYCPMCGEKLKEA